jgi:DNA-binding transcriptional LysR family regulator
MLPLLKQCYDSALAAHSVAKAIKSGEAGTLRLALSRTIDRSLVMPHVVELGKLFRGLELRLFRGTAPEVLKFLKDGQAELAIGASLGEDWERLDSWPLFSESFHVYVACGHPLAQMQNVCTPNERVMLGGV